MRFSKEIKRLIKTTKVMNFPIGIPELKQIIEFSNWEVYSYKDAAEIIDSYNLHSTTKSNDSFVAVISGRKVIFYDENISQFDLPRVLAHEIGCIVLGYLDNTDDIFAKERDCEQFADELLNYTPSNQKLLYSCAGVIGLCLVGGGIAANISNPPSNVQDYSSNQEYSSNTLPIQNETEDYLPDYSLEATTELGSNEHGEKTEPTHTSMEISTSPEDDNKFVYITSHGSKYHLPGCRYIEGKDNLIALTVDEAEVNGFEPCKVCFGS